MDFDDDLSSGHFSSRLRRHDPAAGVPGAAPNFSRVLIPEILTYSGRNSAFANVFRNPDQAIRESLENARFMRNDPSIMECLEARQRAVALLHWHIEPEDQENPHHKRLADDMTDVLSRIPRFTEYRRNLMEAIWYGRHACQNVFALANIKGQQRVIVYRWLPVHGDKLVFRWDDGTGRYVDGQVGVRTTTLGPLTDPLAGDRVTEMSDQGPAYFFKPWERSMLTVHKHIIEDGAYEDALSAGRIHGVGIRDRIYWCWFQKQETMAQLMEVIERTGTGFTIYYYEYGNPASKAAVREVAENQTKSNIILMPRAPGDEHSGPPMQRIEPNTVAINTLQQIVHEFFEHQIKRYIMGQILSSESASTGLGSGVADLHQDTFYQIVNADAVNLEETITTELLAPLTRYNFPVSADNVRLYFRLNTKDAQSQQRLAAYKTGWEMGLKIKAADVYDVIGASLPKKNEEVLSNARGGGAVPASPQPKSATVAEMPAGAAGAQPRPPGGINKLSTTGNGRANGASAITATVQQSKDAPPLGGSFDIADADRRRHPPARRANDGKRRTRYSGEGQEPVLVKNPEFERKRARLPNGEFAPQGEGEFHGPEMASNHHHGASPAPHPNATIHPIVNTPRDASNETDANANTGSFRKLDGSTVRVESTIHGKRIIYFNGQEMKEIEVGFIPYPDKPGGLRYFRAPDGTYYTTHTYIDKIVPLSKAGKVTEAEANQAVAIAIAQGKDPSEAVVTERYWVWTRDARIELTPHQIGMIEAKGGFTLDGPVVRTLDFLSPHLDIRKFKTSLLEGKTPAEAIAAQKYDIAFNLLLSYFGGKLGKAANKWWNGKRYVVNASEEIVQKALKELEEFSAKQKDPAMREALRGVRDEMLESVAGTVGAKYTALTKLRDSLMSFRNRDASGVLTKAEREEFAKSMKDFGVWVEYGTKGADGKEIKRFMVLNDGKALLSLPENATWYQALHESGHFWDWINRGKPNRADWLKIPYHEREKAVFDWLKAEWWDKLTPELQSDAWLQWQHHYQEFLRRKKKT